MVDIVTEGTTLVLSGDFDVRSTGAVRDALRSLLDGPDRHMVVDLTAVVTTDVTALRVLAAATRQAARDGRRLQLRGCCPRVRRLLHLTHLIRVVEIEHRAVVSPTGLAPAPAL